MGRLKLCNYEDRTKYTETVDYLGCETCDKCKHAYSKSKVICRLSFWEIHKYFCTSDNKRRVMIARTYWLKDIRRKRRELQFEIKEWGHLPTRKEIEEIKTVDRDIYLEQMRMETDRLY